MEKWFVNFHPDFDLEYGKFSDDVQDAIAAVVGLLEIRGPLLGRPHCDSLRGSSFSNMKELRVTVVSGEWRVAFAFDAKRQAIVLVAGNKAGVAQKRFYSKLIGTADKRYAEHVGVEAPAVKRGRTRT
jgi:hypothetical protein